MADLPLDGVLVLEFCQYLSGPSAGLRLADLGARVIKIESHRGDACRKLAIEDLWDDEDDSLLFHTINRNKESYTANLKDPDDLTQVKKLVAKADVLIHNFRPGVMEKLGLGNEDTSQLNPGLIYSAVSGYGSEGEWSKKPGQDLLLQAKSGLMYTSGSADDPPVPFGLAIGDILCGAQLVQGILAGLIHREKTGKGTLLELSLLESLLDFQFESLTTFFATGEQPKRSEINNGHALLGAPYGIYETKDGHMALAMMDLSALAKAIELKEIAGITSDEVFSKRDEIKEVIAVHLKGNTSAHWLQKLQKEGLWATDLKNWQQLAQSEGYKAIDPVQEIGSQGQRTTRCPIQLDDKVLKSDRPAPKLGNDSESIIKEFELNETA